MTEGEKENNNKKKAPHELESAATSYALEAVKFEKQGNKDKAMALYQKAIESLLQIVQLYPEYGLNKVYVQRAIACQERIKALSRVSLRCPE